MRICRLVIAFLVLSATAGLTGCDTTPSAGPDFKLLFKYGITARNELNTFEGTYTKDMIDKPPITIDMSLSNDELDRIYQKMVEIDFFDYPDEFSVPVEGEETISIVRPYPSYYFKVEYDSGVKELRWEDEIKNENEEADRLRELIRLIRDVIENKAEYKELPEPTSGYM